jgi:MFS superfamily sulfate permease-like transporter
VSFDLFFRSGLPVEYGLYSAFVPVYIYAIYGSSRQLAVGPVALVSLLFSSGLTKMQNKGLVFDITTVAVQASFLVGLINIAMGLFRLGFITIFLSHSVISGFISGSSIIIGCSQLKYL